MRNFEIKTLERTELVEITAEVQKAVWATGLQEGACVVYCPHTSAGLTIQEHADPDVVHDLLLWLNKHIPKELPGFRHGEGNSDAHIKSALIGSSLLVVVSGGKLVLGTWQGIFFCEFDGPRKRSIIVQTIGNTPPNSHAEVAIPR
jgi:secondary thiamine-phosphate synthase enzyme